MAEEKNELAFYPQYCFKLSPTLNDFCYLRSCDIDALREHPDFRQDVYFHRNLPVKWVRIAGIIVAVDEYADAGKRVYTVDDSSGVGIECFIEIPKPSLAVGVALNAKSGAKAAPEASKDSSATKSAAGTTTLIIPDDVDVGTVIEVKGGLSMFRGSKQVKALKMTVLRSTEQEVAFWEKTTKFRREVLEKPWKLTEKEIKKCQRDEENTDRYGSRHRSKARRVGMK